MGWFMVSCILGRGIYIKIDVIDMKSEVLRGLVEETLFQDIGK